MRKGNLTNWIAVLCLAAAGMPAAAQQSPSVMSKVRSLLGQSPAAKPAAAPAPAAPAPAQAPKPATSAAAPSPDQLAKPAAVAGTPAPVQTAKPVATPAAPLGNRPSAPTVKPVSGPAAPGAPAASADSHGPSKPAGNAPLKTVAATVPGAKGAPANTPVKPGAANSKLIPTTANPKAAAEAKAEAPKDVPRDIPKTAAIPAIVPVKENISRRDPFSPLLAKEATGNGTPLNLPPGKPGLMIGSLHINGIVNGPNGMIAIVANPQQRVYFLREGDHLYDGQVQHITMDGISFHQTGKDPFGNAVEREVAKRLNSTSPGEEQ
jgi:hypothetical protein